jgi:hypothetical protein
MSKLVKTLATLMFTLCVAAPAAEAQLRDIVTKNVSASSSGATLELEFGDDGALEIRFEDGEILVDGNAVAQYTPGDRLDSAWRSLLAEAMQLENGALARMLDDWRVPGDFAGEIAEAARIVDETLEDALSEVTLASAATSPQGSISIEGAHPLLELLLGSALRVGAVQEALEEADASFRIHVDEDVVIEGGERLEGTLVIVGGTLTVRGTIDGDVVMVGGALELSDSGSISGEARVSDTEVRGSVDRIAGGLMSLSDEAEFDRTISVDVSEKVRDQLRRELRDEMRAEIHSAATASAPRATWSIFSPVRAVARGVGGVLEKLFTILLIGMVGLGIAFFAGDKLDTVAETARQSPGRSAMVGFAGTFLLVPVWLLGAAALVVSVIGIPVAIAWLPLFPLAAAAAVLFGYIAVARNTGEWLAESGYPWTGWIRQSNSLMTLFGGLVGLWFAFLAANVLSIVPFAGFLTGLLIAVGTVLTVLAAHIGLGAVILTRGGRQPASHGRYDSDAAWEAAVGTTANAGPSTGRTDDVMGGEDEDVDA